MAGGSKPHTAAAATPQTARLAGPALPPSSGRSSLPAGSLPAADPFRSGTRAGRRAQAACGRAAEEGKDGGGALVKGESGR